MIDSTSNHRILDNIEAAKRRQGNVAPISMSGSESHYAVERALTASLSGVKKYIADKFDINPKKFKIKINAAKLLGKHNAYRSVKLSSLLSEGGRGEINIEIIGAPLACKFIADDECDVKLQSSMVRRPYKYESGVITTKRVSTSMADLVSGNYVNRVYREIDAINGEELKKCVDDQFTAHKNLTRTHNSVDDIRKLFNKFPCTLHYDPSNVNVTVSYDGKIQITLTKTVDINPSEYTSGETINDILSKKLGMPSGTIELSQF